MQMIHETVMNLGYEDTMTEIYSVDSQYSKDGGVVVQVTGALQAKGRAKRLFVQTFFLAVQEKGYFVLNDIFRYLLPPGLASGIGDEDETLTAAFGGGNASGSGADDAAENNGASGGSSPSPISPTSRTSEKQYPRKAGSSTTPDQEGEHPTKQTQPQFKATSLPVPAPPLPPVPHPATTSAAPFTVTASLPPLPIVAPPPARSNGVPAMVPIAYGVPPPPPLPVPVAVPAGSIPIPIHPHIQMAVPVVAESTRGPYSHDGTAPSSHQGSPGAGYGGGGGGNGDGSSSRRPPPPPPRPDSSAAAGRAHEGGAGPDDIDSHPNEGVFIRDIPPSVSLEMLAEVLSSFGPLSPGSLSLKTQRGRDSYAFVDFMNPESAAACLAHGLEIGGRRVTTEPKRPLIFRQPNTFMRGPTAQQQGGPQQAQQGQQQSQHAQQQQQQQQGIGGGGGRGPGSNYRGGPGGRGGMMPRHPGGPQPQSYGGPGIPYPGPMMMFPQGMGMAMAMPQQMMDASGYAMGPPSMVSGGGRGRGGGRYDGSHNGAGGRGRGGRGPPPAQMQMPYA